MVSRPLRQSLEVCFIAAGQADVHSHGEARSFPLVHGVFSAKNQVADPCSTPESENEACKQGWPAATAEAH